MSSKDTQIQIRVFISFLNNPLSVMKSNCLPNTTAFSQPALKNE